MTKLFKVNKNKIIKKFENQIINSNGRPLILIIDGDRFLVQASNQIDDLI